MRNLQRALLLFFCLALVGLVAASQGFSGVPQPQMATYTGQGISFSYPADWEVQEGGESLSIVPPYGRRRLPDGREWLTHGIFVGSAPQGPDLPQDTENLLRSVQSSNPNLRKMGALEPYTVGGQQALVGRYTNVDASLPSLTEEGFLLTVHADRKLWYWVIFCPQNEGGTCSALFWAVKESIQFVGSVPPLGATLPVSHGRPNVYVEPSITLVRGTFQISAGNVLTHNFSLLPGSGLVAEFQVSGGLNDRIDVFLLDAANYQRYMAGQRFSVFSGTSGAVRGVAKYTFRVPQASVYYLILDNRRAWLMPRQVKLYVYAILPRPTPEHLQTEQALSHSYEMLRQLFVFSDFQIAVRHCGVENAYSDPNITLCVELVENIGDQRLDAAVSFVFFHELGHSLLRLWGLPGWDNEDYADEFATVLMILAKQQAGALQAAQWWASRTSEQEALSKLWVDDRHSVSPQRARNIIRWLNQEDELIRRWYRVFIPNMQSDALRSGLEDADPRIDKELILAELKRRGASP